MFRLGLHSLQLLRNAKLETETPSLHRADTRDVGRWQQHKSVHWKSGSQSSGLVEQRSEMKVPSNQQGEL